MYSNSSGLNGVPALAQRSAEADAPARSRRLLLIATVVAVALQFLPYSNYLLYPLRLFVTFIHESGHALAAIITGGNVVSLTISPDGSGLTRTQNPVWATWLMLSGGYLGATIFGALLLQVGRLSRWRNAGRVTLYAAAGYLLVITLLWGYANLFTLISGIVLAGLLFVLARISTPQAANFISSFLAVQCCLNALVDLRTLLYLTTNMPGRDNDAVFMQQSYLLPAVFWASLWAITAICILGLALRSYWRGTAASARRTVI
jgi:hypothetical protein